MTSRIRAKLKDANFSIQSLDAKGDCFYEAVSRAADLERYTVDSLRALVATSLTPDVFTMYISSTNENFLLIVTSFQVPGVLTSGGSWL